MSQQIDAIYDNGVFKPLVPISIPDKAHVRLTVDALAESGPADKLSAQKDSLRALWQEIDKLPQHHNNDGWPVRQHDELLYGGRK